jgi:hypothetical protein
MVPQIDKIVILERDMTTSFPGSARPMSVGVFDDDLIVWVLRNLDTGPTETMATTTLRLFTTAVDADISYLPDNEVGWVFLGSVIRDSSVRHVFYSLRTSIGV